MIDERFADAVSAWLRRTDSPSRHAEDNVGRAMAQIRDRRQRRWLWFLPSRRPTAGADDQATRAEPDPTIIDSTGGTRTMFSATKLVGFAAGVALFGALMLAVPFGSRDTQAPAAPAPDLGEITAFTGEIQLLGQDRTGTFERYDWGTGTKGEQWTFRLTTTDPRYSGVGTGFHDVYEVGPDRTVLRLQNGRLFTRDENGTWLTTGRSYQDPETTRMTYVTNSSGEGTYAGLSAFAICEQAENSYDMECRGIVFEGEWPELPSEAPTEIDAAYEAP